MAAPRDGMFVIEPPVYRLELDPATRAELLDALRLLGDLIAARQREQLAVVRDIWSAQLEQTERLLNLVSRAPVAEEANPPRCALCDHIEALHSQVGSASHPFTPRPA